MKKKKRIPLDEEANGLEKSKYRLAASPFPAIATKKEETSVAEEGCVSLIAVRKVYKPVAKALRKRTEEIFSSGAASKEKAPRNFIGSACRKAESFGKKSSRRGSREYHKFSKGNRQGDISE
ncbi:hypothetical protein WN51_04870 [Melipona quadrifasciata]|uniref:Uncharacterized protein n=1 Tax=Melipona quadrifasciata TaxID=166423 RepID=A0A0M8ZSB1_9HYME|nr:hypothetical protein WN51_04870 [Melipona quadrifasciata]